MPTAACVRAGVAGEVRALTADAASTSEAVLTTLTVPANTVRPGTTWRIFISGDLTTSNTSRTLTLRIRWGGLAGTVVVATAALAFANTTTNPIQLEAILTIRSVGASGTAKGALRWRCASLSVVDNLTDSGATPVTIDTTAAKDIVVTAAQSAGTVTFNARTAFTRLVRL